MVGRDDREMELSATPAGIENTPDSGDKVKGLGLIWSAVESVRRDRAN